MVAVLGAATAALIPRAAAATPASLGTQAGTTAANKARLAESYGRLPMSFEANQGQAPQRVRFMARGEGYALYLTGEGAVLTLRKSQGSSAWRGLRRKGRFGRSPEILGLFTPAGKGFTPRHLYEDRSAAQADAVQMKLEGARAGLQPIGVEELPGTANYLLGKDAARWHTGVPTFARVRYEGVYPGVDLLYYGNQRQLEYDFVVAPGADPKPIRLRFDGTKSVKLDRAGNLVIAASDGDVAFQKPVVYQMEGGQRRPVEGNFRLLGKNRAGFALGSYDRSKPLVIDPVLSYATYLGGSDQEAAVSIAVDAAGDAYMTGLTWSVDFPVTAGAYQAVNYATSANSVSTAFICELNPSGTALIYSTYLGGDASPGNIYGQGDYGHSIAVDSNGNAYVTGWTFSNNFPVTANAYQSTNQAAATGGPTGFISELNSSGTGLVYSTYLGGSTADEPTSLALDSNGNVYTTGFTFSSDYPTTSGAFQTTLNSPEGWNIFVSKLSPTATGLIYSTYLGGSGEDGITLGGVYVLSSVAVDASGDAYVASLANSNDYPVTPGAYQSTNLAYNADGTNITLSELNPTGTGLIYSTYLGGGSFPGDFSSGLVIDSSGDAYVTGYTYSPDFPTTTGAYQTTNTAAITSGNETVFASEINPTGTGLVYSTFLGGSVAENAYALALDSSGDLYLTGATASSNFPVTADAYQSNNTPAASSSSTAFLTELNPAGTGLVYSTFLGGSVLDDGYGVALGGGGPVYMTGYTRSPDFPVTPGAFETTYNSAFGTAFVAEFNLGTAPATIATTTTLVSSANPEPLGGVVTFTATVTPVSGTGIPTGNLVFSIDEVTVATVALDSNGQASYLASSLSGGQHYVLASYGGDSNYAPSGKGLTQTIQFPPPTISTLAPFVATAGGTGFTLTVNGTNFYAGATVLWGSTALATTYVSAIQLTALVPANLITAAGSAAVTVLSSGGTSAPATFTITPSTAFPLLLSLSPGSMTAGAIIGEQFFALTVSGANFVPGSFVLWNGSIRTTTYVSSTELTADIGAADTMLAATDLVTVSNPAPYAATSAALPFVVLSATPIAAISGASISDVPDGSGNYFLTLTGSNFVPASIVNWNGTKLTTTYVSPSQISAVVTAFEYASLPAVVTVTNPAGTSAGFELQ